MIVRHGEQMLGTVRMILATLMAEFRANGMRVFKEDNSSGKATRLFGGEFTAEERMTFEEFAAAQLYSLLRFSTTLTNDRGLGEDLVQDVLLRAQARWDRIGSVDAPSAYVRRMIVNEFVSWRRKWARIVPSSDVAMMLDERADDHHADHPERDALQVEIAALPRRQRAVIVLRYYEDLSDSEIAEVLGCSQSTVRGYAMRALRTLRVGRAAADPRSLAAHRGRSQ